jgi:hypothetical protein
MGDSTLIDVALPVTLAILASHRATSRISSLSVLKQGARCKTRLIVQGCRKLTRMNCGTDHK